MDFIKVVPSATFVAVLEELHVAPGAPSSVAKFFKNKKLTKEKKSKCEEDLEDPPELLLRTSEVKWCHEEMRRRGVNHRIHELINESKLLLPKPKEKPKNPQLQARLEKLRAEEENRVYRSMTRNLR